MTSELMPFWVSIQLAFMTTLVLVVIGLPMAYRLAFSRSRWKYIWESLINLPLVLPPTVMGFYLLVIFSPHNLLGKFLWDVFHWQVIFTFPGLVIGSMLISLPFMVNPLKSAMENFPRSLIEAASVLGKSPWQIFVHVILPNIKPALASAVVMTFAHTLGEFGVVLMIGGSLPGQTQTASIAIFNAVESMDYRLAYFYSGLLSVGAFVVLLIVGLISRRAIKGSYD